MKNKKNLLGAGLILLGSLGLFNKSYAQNSPKIDSSKYILYGKNIDSITNIIYCSENGTTIKEKYLKSNKGLYKLKNKTKYPSLDNKIEETFNIMVKMSKDDWDNPGEYVYKNGFLIRKKIKD